MESWGTAVFLLVIAIVIVALGVVVTRMVKSIDPNDAARLVDTEKVSTIALYGKEDGPQEYARPSTSIWNKCECGCRRYEEAVRTWQNNWIATGQRIEQLQKVYGDRLAVLEKQMTDYTHVADMALDVRRLRGYVNTAADKARTALEVARSTDAAVQNIIDGEALHAAACAQNERWHEMIESEVLHAAARVQNERWHEMTEKERWHEMKRWHEMTEKERAANARTEASDPDLRLYCCGACRASNGENCEVRAYRCKHDEPIAFHEEGGCDT